MVRLSPLQPRSRIDELDGLRALAVAAVISFHYTIATAWANAVTGLGWAGVDLFFVLSGFLITSILLGSRGKPKYFSTFYARRTLRIFPVYYVVLAVYALSAVVLGGRQSWLYWLLHALYLSSVAEYFHIWMFAAPVFVYAGLAVLWSLSIEELFYLVWAPVVRWVRAERLWVVLAVAIVGAPLLRWHLHTPRFPEYEFLPTRCDSLAWGAALALVVAHRQTRPRLAAWLGRLALAAGGVFVLLSVLIGSSRSELWMATAGYSLLAMCFAGLIGWTVLHAGSGAALCRLLRLRPARWLGKVSYTTYLVHYPMLSLAAALGWGLLGRDGLGVVFTLLVAAACWRWLESPLLRLKDRWRPAMGHLGEPAAGRLRTVEVSARLS